MKKLGKKYHLLNSSIILKQVFDIIALYNDWQEDKNNPNVLMCAVEID